MMLQLRTWLLVWLGALWCSKLAASSTERQHSRGSLTSAAPTCAAAPTAFTEFSLIGAGQCVNAEGLTPRAFRCNASMPAQCVNVTGSVEACVAQCNVDDGCTGFEVRLDATTGAVTDCLVFFSTLPIAVPPVPWVLAQNGTQSVNSSRITVVAADAAAVGLCCYRRAYPRPCPLDMPIVVPPKQSARAQAIFANRSQLAQAASEAVMPQLEALVDFCVKNASSSLFTPAAVCPGLADLTLNGTIEPPAAQIVQRFGEEMKALEYAHGYAPMWDAWGCTGGNCLRDWRDLFNPSFPLLMNLYQPLTLGLNSTPTATAARFDPVMQDIFGCDAFAGGVKATLSFREAADRVTYTAANYVRGPMGNIINQVGGFNAILRPDYVRDMMLMTPGDSWHYEAQYPNCTAWMGCHVGTIDYPYHTLYAWMTGGGPQSSVYSPTPTAASCAAQTAFLRYVVCELPPTRSNPRGRATIPSEYFEVDAIGMIRYPEGVKLITASFGDVFGTERGTYIRAWCQRWKWVLAWVLHDASAPLDARRLLDPAVLPNTTVNATIAPTVAANFETMWNAAVASRGTKTNFSDYVTVWDAFVNETTNAGVEEILSWNIGARDCQDYNNCFGTAHSTGLCLCYANTSASQAAHGVSKN